MRGGRGDRPAVRQAHAAVEPVKLSDWRTLSLNLPETADDELAAYLTHAAVEAGALGGQLEEGRLTLYLPRDADEALARAVRQSLGESARTLGFASNALRVADRRLADAPWATAWKDRFKSFAVGRRLLIRPEWERGPASTASAGEDWAGRVTIWLTPGQGFGTGHHETTRLALEWLEEELAPGMTVLDFGSGSAILTIAARQLGAARVVAIECDRDANQNARENLALNGLSTAGGVELIEADTPERAAGRFDLIVCNMLPRHALAHFGALAARLAGPRSRLIYGGYLADEKGEPAQALIEAGLTPLCFRADGEWGACLAGPSAETES